MPAPTRYDAPFIVAGLILGAALAFLIASVA